MPTSSRRTISLAIIISAGIILILLALTIGNLRYARENPGGNDFLVHWMGTRKLLVEGVSPYSNETAEAIQTFAYGRPARADEHQLRVAYPLYSIVLFLPFALVKDFVLARALWMTLLEVGLVFLAFLSARLAKWRPQPVLLTAYLLFAILSYHSLRPVINGNAVIVIAILICGGLLAVKNKADELGGVLFAFSTIKPQLTVLLLVFVVIWALKQGRQKIVIWLLSTVVLLILSAMLLIPDWIIQNALEILRYPQYNPPLTLQTALSEIFPSFGIRIGWAAAGIIAVILLLEWLYALRGGIKEFLFASVITLLASQWIGIPTDPGNFIILFPAIVLILEAWERRWVRGAKYYNMILLLIIFVLPWLIFLQTVEAGPQPQQSPVMFLPLPTFLWIFLYWSRWWILQADEKVQVDYLDDETPLL